MEGYDPQQAFARSRIYQLLSGAFLYPGDDFFALLHQGYFIEELREWGEFLPDEPKNGFLQKLREQGAAFKGLSLEELKLEYGRVLGHSVSKDCPPCETEYGVHHVFQQTQTLADISGFYRAFGLEVSQEQGERLDHIGVELEFMGFLAYKEYYASARHGEDKVQICRDAQQKFLKENLGRWAPLFLRLLMNKATNGFYYGLGALTEEFLKTEMRFFKVHPEPIGELQPQRYEFDDTCVSCVNNSEKL